MTYECKVTHRADGSVECEEFFKEGKLHREGDRPASIYYRPGATGRWTFRESFYKEEQLHREGDRPAVVEYRADGSVKWELFYKKGKLHREGDRPAMVEYRADGSVHWEEFYKEGELFTPSNHTPSKTVEIDGVKYVLTLVG